MSKNKNKNKNKKNAKKDKLIIIDIEATFWHGRAPEGQRQEIIEIGIAVLDLNSKEIEDNNKGIIVIPTNSKISYFCTKLTSIDDKLIKKEGVSFEDACNTLKEEYDSSNFIWGSWGPFDKSQFLKDCKFKNVDYPLSDSYIDLQKMFSNHLDEKRQYGVKTALEHLDLQFEGQEHRGYIDAWNTARIIKEIPTDIILNHAK